MNICKVTTVLIFFPFIIGCSSKEDSDVIENNVTEDIEVLNEIQDDSIKPNSTGVFTFTPTGVLSDKSINVYYHTPQGDLTNFPILFSFHGGSRNADDYRDDWIQMANANNFMVFAPEFNSDDFPSGDMYNLANIFQDGDNPSSDTFNSPDSWTFSIIDQLFDFIKSEIGGNQTTYNAWGHSAGAQFLHRFVFYLPDSKLNIAVCSNAGWYTVPESGVVFPYGILESQLSNSNLISAFSKKLYVHLGDADTDPNSSSLRHNDIVDEQQGLNRLVRGRYFFETSQEKAESLNATFNWEKTPEVSGVGHDHTAMALDALQYILEE
tara:strand:- start:313 stop:1281 length:969 start_codon:yes stop_codon:yes gene_type:complete